MMNQSQIQIILSHNIQACRTIRRLTQKQLAEAIGVTRPRIGSWEEGRGCPNCEMILSLARYFEVDLRRFMTVKFPKEFMI